MKELHKLFAEIAPTKEGYAIEVGEVIHFYKSEYMSVSMRHDPAKHSFNGKIWLVKKCGTFSVFSPLTRQICMSKCLQADVAKRADSLLDDLIAAYDGFVQKPDPILPEGVKTIDITHLFGGIV